MSHLKERKEKDCLNCGAEVQGRYCQVCGQENIEPKESFWHLVTHFMYDITHFDGKFFSTLKYLLFKPGFLSHEYLKGRRASYLHPIRMYVFTSAFFFLIFFSVGKGDDAVKISDDSGPSTAASILKKLERNKAKNEKVLAEKDVPEIAKVPLRKVLANIDSDIALLKRDSTAKNNLKTLNARSAESINLFGNPMKDARTIAQYDSIQKSLPANDRDNFLTRRFAYQKIHLREKYHDDSKEIMTAVIEKFKHLFPQMLFVSLPLFALILQLLYISRKRFYYVNHVVFTIHLYCGTFIILLLSMAIQALAKAVHVTTGWIEFIITISLLFYWYKSFRNFYEQRRGKTILKYLLVLFASCFLMVVIFVVFFIFSAMAI